jgi:4-hydroxybenzoate polyprenyltransferase
MSLAKTYQTVVWPYLDLARPYNSAAALLSFACGYCFYAPLVSWVNFLLGLIVVVLVHSAFTMQNDLNDVDVDMANGRETALTMGIVKTSVLKQVIGNMVLASLVIAWFGSHKTYYLGFILAYGGLAYAYNSPPFYASRKPVVSIALLGSLYALIPLFFGILASGNDVTRRFVVFAAAMTLTRLSISILKDFKDAKGDKRHGKRTFYLSYGRKATILISGCLALLGYPLVAVAVAWQRDLSELFAGLLALGALATLTYRLRLFSAAGESQLAGVFRRSFMIENYFGSLILLCLLAS